MADRQIIYRDFGRLIAQARKNANLTQAQLAGRVGLSRTSIANVERGAQGIQLHDVYDFAAALDVDVHHLIPGREPREKVLKTIAELDILDWLQRATFSATKPPSRKRKP